jgi:hypothetical protein
MRVIKAFNSYRTIMDDDFQLYWLGAFQFIGKPLVLDFYDGTDSLVPHFFF